MYYWFKSVHLSRPGIWVSPDNLTFLYRYVLYSTLLHLPPLRFHCVGGCLNEPRTVAISALAVRSLQPLGQISSTLGQISSTQGQISSTLGQISSTLGYRRSHPSQDNLHRLMFIVIMNKNISKEDQDFCCRLIHAGNSTCRTVRKGRQQLWLC